MYFINLKSILTLFIFFQQIRQVAQYSYRILKLDNDKAANMLYVNGRLIHRTREEIGDRSYSVSTPLTN